MREVTVPVSEAVTTESDSVGSIRFGVITDTHQIVEDPARQAALTSILEHLSQRDPHCVLHCGDITNNGGPEQLDLYWSLVPPSLRSRMRHVAGNHDASWDASVLQEYSRRFGPTNYSFDVPGLHVVALTPLVGLETFPTWRLRPDVIDWLTDDLERSDGRPIVIFTHFPLVGGWLLVDDPDLSAIIDRFPIRAVFAGHIHREGVSRENGVTQVVGSATFQGPYYYWAEGREGSEGPVLDIIRVHLADNTQVTTNHVTSIPLTGPRPGQALQPTSVRHRFDDDDRLSLQVQLPTGADVVRISARIHPHGDDAGGAPWTELSSAGGRWTTTISVLDVTPGRHRVDIRVTGADAASQVVHQQVELACATPMAAWNTDVGGPVLGALAQRGDLVVVGTTTGVVSGFGVTPSSEHLRWRTRVGPVFRGPVFALDGGQVMVPSGDHYLYGLDSSSGQQRWRTDLGAPVVSEVCPAQIDGVAHVVVAAGARLFCLREDGTVRWRSALGGTFAGAMISDHDHVYVANSRALVSAVDLDDGHQVWSTGIGGSSGDHFRPGQGAWRATLRQLSDGSLVVTSTRAVHLLEAASGVSKWVSREPFAWIRDTPTTITPHGILIFESQTGDAYLLDPDSGAVTNHSTALPASFGSGPIEYGLGKYWMVGQTGLVAHIATHDLRITPLLQLGTPVNGTAALVGSVPDQLLVAAGQDGHLHGITGLREPATA